MKIEPILDFSKNYWQLLVGIAAFVITTVFFLSYSLARHKRMVFKLRTEVLHQKTLLTVEKLEKKSALARLRLLQLSTSDTKVAEERKKIETDIKKIDAGITKAKSGLKKDLSGLDKKSLVDLLRQAEQLEKDTL